MKYLFLFLVFLSGCREISIIGDKFAKIYPKDGYADVSWILQQKSGIKVTDPVDVKLDTLSGWICMDEQQFARYRREFERNNMIEGLQAAEYKLNTKRIQDVNNQD